MLSRLRNYDFLLLIPITLLLGIGFVTLYSLSPVSGDAFFKKQLLWAALGAVAMVWISSVDYRLFRSKGAIVFILYLLSLVSLALLFLIGARIKGVEGWFHIGGFLLQPVEFFKIVVIILLAKYLSGRHVEIHRWRNILVSGAYIAAASVFLLLQPDVGSTIVLISVWIGMMILSGIPARRLAVIGVACIVFSGIMWQGFLAPYQKARITNFINPWKDPQGGGYQTIQSMIAVGAGRITGEGIGYGTQSHLHFLPEPETDFIFATFAEEWGFAGSSVLFIIFGFLFWRLYALARAATDNFSRLFILGFLILLCAQCAVHIGGNTGMMPITGLTLPFVSYGGSSMLALFIGLGIIQSMHIHKSISLRHDIDAV